MERAELIQEVKKYFKIQELVSEAVYKKHGDERLVYISN